MEASSSSKDRDGSELELEDVVSDLHALKNLYGLLHKSKAKKSQGIDSGQGIIDENSSIMLKRLLDSATQHALQCQAKIVSSTMEPLSSLEKQECKPKEEHEDINTQMQTPDEQGESHSKPFNSQHKSYSPMDPASTTVEEPDNKADSASVVEPKMDPNPRRPHLTRQRSDKSTRNSGEKSSSTRPDRTARVADPRRISARREATPSAAPWTSQKRSRPESSTRYPSPTESTQRTPSDQISKDPSLTRAKRSVDSEKAAGREKARLVKQQTATTKTMERSHRSASRASHYRVTEERKPSYHKPSKPRRDPKRVTQPPRQHRDPVGPPEIVRLPPRIPSRMKSIRYSSTSSSSSTVSDTRGSARAPHPRRDLDVRTPVRRRTPSRLPLVQARATGAPAPRRMLSRSHHGKAWGDDRKKPGKTGETGRLRRLKNKISVIFHHHHHHHVHDGERVHRKAWQYLRRMIRGKKKKGAGEHEKRGAVGRHQQHGQLHALLELLLRHVWGTRQRRAAKAEGERRRRLMGRVGVKKLHWWQRFRKRGGVKLMGAGRSKPRLRLGFTRGRTKNNKKK